MFYYAFLNTAASPPWTFNCTNKSWSEPESLLLKLFPLDQLYDRPSNTANSSKSDTASYQSALYDATCPWSYEFYASTVDTLELS